MTSATSHASDRSIALEPKGLIGRQVLGILRLELRRNLFSRRSFALYFLAFAPLFVVALWALSPLPKKISDTVAVTDPMYATIFQIGYVRVLIFLSSLFFFMSLFRSEILEKSLHYYFLTPVRRDVLAVGKYLAALISTGATFAVSSAVLFVLMRLPWGVSELSQHLFRGPGLGHLLTYMGLAIMACAGYGAIFLLAGLFFRNPIVPGALLWGWEAINAFLPTLLQKFSVVHYLQALYPIPLTGRGGWFEIFAEPTPGWIAVPGFVIFTVLVLAVTGWRVRHLELNYGGD